MIKGIQKIEKGLLSFFEKFIDASHQKLKNEGCKMKELMCKCKVDGNREVEYKALDVPESLQEINATEDQILKFIISQVIAHKLHSQVRQAYKKGLILQEVNFSLPIERQATPKVSKELASKLQGLSPEKLEQLLNLLNN